MVNVAGRSKACSTCRKRRIKCDETQPICQRCQKLGLACDGPKTLVFVEGKIIKSRRTQKPPTKVARARSKTGWKMQDADGSLSVSPVCVSLVQDVELRFNEYEVYICHLRHRLYPNGPIDLGLQKMQLSDLPLDRTSTNSEDNALFNQAALSFAILLFGARNNQARILAKGYDMHGAALRQLNHALSVPGCHNRDDIINVITIMAMVELYLPSGPRNWLRHMLGLEQLIALRDPSSLAYAPLQTLEMYKGVRHMILIASLRNRSPSILAQPGWKAVLRMGISLESKEEQELHDVLADCSVLVAASDQIAVRKSSTYDSMCTDRATEISTKAMDLLASLQMWKMRWDRNVENAHITEYDSEAVCAGAPQALHTVYRFHSDSAARMFMLYNTALIYVLQIIVAIDGLHPSHQVMLQAIYAAIPGTSGRVTTCLYATAMDIVRSISDYLRHRRVRGNTDFASPVVQWAVLTAWQVLGGNESVEGKRVMQSLAGYDEYVVAKTAWKV